MLVAVLQAQQAAEREAMQYRSGHAGWDGSDSDEHVDTAAGTFDDPFDFPLDDEGAGPAPYIQRLSSHQSLDLDSARQSAPWNMQPSAAYGPQAAGAAGPDEDMDVEEDGRIFAPQAPVHEARMDDDDNVFNTSEFDNYGFEESSFYAPQWLQQQQQQQQAPQPQQLMPPYYMASQPPAPQPQQPQPQQLQPAFALSLEASVAANMQPAQLQQLLRGVQQQANPAASQGAYHLTPAPPYHQASHVSAAGSYFAAPGAGGSVQMMQPPPAYGHFGVISGQGQSSPMPPLPSDPPFYTAPPLPPPDAPPPLPEDESPPPRPPS